MEDQMIIELYFTRDEAAIRETRDKYGPYLTAIAYNILCSFEDTEECVSDTYLRAWNAIPPARPGNLKGYLGRTAHNLALSRYRSFHAKKRGALTEVLEELEVPALEDPQETLEQKELAKAISDFLRTLPSQKRRVFVLRYWYCESLSAIGRTLGWRESRVKTELYRMRKKLKNYLEQEGIVL